ncbi:TPA: hypothetical protein ACN7ID_000325 [Klebsiella pneumoniae]|uniref:hypothetical protein n=1 Tax=Klebsiella sp. FK2020ZBJ35 TaxID=2911174 RepID=UPI000926140E|nr:hypothetical protein [Klebsiella sp. FK2020ZBJ35]MBS6740809.1 hypothetical protein [Enterobacteriaceae bacterium]OJS86632.1 hypothetical protein BK400_25995 [Escherichia coli]RXX52752.1 hypothetical protein DD566_27255 [Klebsiella pneumoniae]MCF8592332.1 hypothetical protein [Klebsiella sp. FK2020ZBJ35]RXY53523.1 hypothetical protein DD568_30500 [Klebsiella pneumoniae]
MQHNYFTYYEGLDSDGAVIFNGNGSFSTEPGRANGQNVIEHGDYLLRTAQEKNPHIARIVIKHITKL